MEKVGPTYKLLTTGAILGLIAYFASTAKAGTSSNSSYNLLEVTRSNIAANNNFTEQFSPGPEIVRNAQIYAQEILDPLNYHLDTRLVPSSWYRAARTNALTKGASSTSDHLTALGSDISYSPGGKRQNKILIRAALALRLPIKELIIYGSLENPSRIHLSYGKGGQILHYSNGKYIPINPSYYA